MSKPSKFLEGPFAPAKEEVTAFDLPVTGSLPASGEKPVLVFGHEHFPTVDCGVP